VNDILVIIRNLTAAAQFVTLCLRFSVCVAVCCSLVYIAERITQLEKCRIQQEHDLGICNLWSEWSISDFR